MIRIEGNIKQVAEFEETIKKGTTYMSVPFGLRLKHIGGADMDTPDKRFNMEFYTHTYEIFGSPERVNAFSNATDKRLVEFMAWLTAKNIVATFVFDNRRKEYSVSFSPDSWHRFKKLYPEIARKVVDIAPNRCEIVVA